MLSAVAYRDKENKILGKTKQAGKAECKKIYILCLPKSEESSFSLKQLEIFFFSFISGLFVLVNILSCKRFLPNMTVKLDESQLKRGKMNWHFWSLLNVLDHIQKWRMFSLWKYLKTHFFRSSAWRKSVNIVLRFSKDIYSHSKTKKTKKGQIPTSFYFDTK